MNSWKFKRLIYIAIIFILFLISIFAVLIINNSASAKQTQSTKIVTSTASTSLNSQAQKDIIKLSIGLFGNSNLKSCEYLYNLDESCDYICVEFKDSGYAIFFSETMELLEYSKTDNIPYPNASKKYYGGPSFYLIKDQDTFINTATNEQIKLSNEYIEYYSSHTRQTFLSDNSSLSNITELTLDNSSVSIAASQNQSQKSIGEIPAIDSDSLIKLTDGTYIPDYRYFLFSPRHGSNSTGTCGAVAAQLMLSYHNYYSDRRIIANNYLCGGISNISLNPNLCSDPMSMTSYTLGTRGYHEDGHDDLNSYFKYLVTQIPANATTAQVKNGINTVLQNRNNELDSSIKYSIDSKTGFLGLTSVNSNSVISELDSGRPVILLMQEKFGGLNHYVVAYGYNNYTYSDSTDSYLGYITHFGWDSNSLNVWVNASWCYSYISMNINHTHEYNTVGKIPGTNRTEYKCIECGHRTDAGINMLSDDKYIEAIGVLPQNGYSYKNFYVTFKTKGMKLFQTFGSIDTEMTLFDINNKQLIYDNDSGYSSNSFFNYNVKANVPYILKIKFNTEQIGENINEISGTIKVGITPASENYNSYEEIRHLNYSKIGYSFIFKSNTTTVICYTPNKNGIYSFTTSSIDNIDSVMYFIDPISTELCLFDNDSAGNFQALINTELISDRRYLIIISANDTASNNSIIKLSIDRP